MKILELDNRYMQRRAWSITLSSSFTIVELLTVVAVIGVLASLLLPSLAKAKSKARAITCLNNVRQLQTGWTLSIDDHSDTLPPLSDGIESGKRPESPSWVAGWLRTRYEGGDQSDNTNTHLLIGPEFLEFGSIGTYVGSSYVYRCPADRSGHVRSFTMNAYMNGVSMWQDTNFVTFRTIGDIRSPCETWALLDEREDSINDGCFGVDMKTHYAIVDYPASYHNGAGVLVFSDGHVESHRWREGTTSPPLRPGYHLPGDSKYTAEDDQDMDWLCARTTIKNQ